VLSLPFTISMHKNSVRASELTSHMVICQYCIVDNSSKVLVLDKAVLILGALEAGPHSLSELVAATGIARPTAHRLAVALEFHRFVGRDLNGKFILGPRPTELAATAGEDHLLAVAKPALELLRDATGESANLFRRHGDQRICVSTAERTSGLRDFIPTGTLLTMQAGSAAQILLAWEDAEKIQRVLGRGNGAKFSTATLSAVRRRGWAQSVGEREAGVASVSAPVRAPNGKVVAAVGISGPMERLGRQPGRLHAAAVVATAVRLSEYLEKSEKGK
jgi:DNA-binding IclR family transcriptional regulator